MSTPRDAQRPAGQNDKAGVIERVLVDLRQRILTREFVYGSRLPSERELASQYGASVASVREAMRGLAGAGMVRVEHGKGVYVTAQADEIFAMSLCSLIQLEDVGIVQVLGVHGALNTYAAELAAARATERDVIEMQRALQAVDHAVTPEDIAAALVRFLHALVNASGNPLLIALCSFLARMQIGLVREIQGKRFEAWRKTAARMANERQRLVDAIRAGDVEGARVASRLYHERSMKTITALPNAARPHVSDLAMSTLDNAFREWVPGSPRR
ncbi:GntR family transcriptional regulator [Burkholderia pseudomultivorans]|uniref:FadR/GntR family transcriptional regulator n=1 Tax=Burkholderia pseudomultivorans TaxID=1207504 RepID=UPI002876C8E4|nr:GntR family transcriptional regulator [Burkholderia pseudomultivorans]MDS0858650.1 GntR family transcriptional regulator [Burkholderia pseudomultivorans]